MHGVSNFPFGAERRWDPPVSCDTWKLHLTLYLLTFCCQFSSVQFNLFKRSKRKCPWKASQKRRVLSPDRNWLCVYIYSLVFCCWNKTLKCLVFLVTWRPAAYCDQSITRWQRTNENCLAAKTAKRTCHRQFNRFYFQSCQMLSQTVAYLECAKGPIGESRGKVPVGSLEVETFLLMNT